MKNWGECKIGIVTVLYNSVTVVDEFFETLDQQTYGNIILYVVDNNSPDGSLEKSQQISKNVGFKTVFIAEKENWGVAKGNNIGIEQALKDGCRYVLLSNNDIVLESTTIENLLKGMLDSNATMAVPKIYFHGTDLIWAAGGDFVYHSGYTKHIGSQQKDLGQFEQVKLLNYSPTCFMLMDSIVLKHVGMMDEAYFVYYDDTDFVWRAVIKGRERLVYIPASRLWHKESTCTNGYYSDFTLRFMHRNLVYFVMKHFSLFHKIAILPFHVLHYFLRKTRIMSSSQCAIVRKAYIEGYRLYKKRN